jgi:hypothetical protein
MLVSGGNADAKTTTAAVRTVQCTGSSETDDHARSASVVTEEAMVLAHTQAGLCCPTD